MFRRTLSFSLAGSLSMAFTTRIPPLPSAEASVSLAQAGKAPPPRPVSPEAFRVAMSWCCHSTSWPVGTGTGP